MLNRGLVWLPKLAADYRYLTNGKGRTYLYLSHWVIYIKKYFRINRFDRFYFSIIFLVLKNLDYLPPMFYCFKRVIMNPSVKRFFFVCLFFRFFKFFFYYGTIFINIKILTTIQICQANTKPLFNVEVNTFNSPKLKIIIAK